MHLSQREKFTEYEVQFYSSEISLALDALHKVAKLIIMIY